MTTFELLSVLGISTLLSTVVSTVISHYFSLSKNKLSARQDYKDLRYKALMLLAYSYLHYYREKSVLLSKRPDLTSQDLLENELEAELINMYLYASDDVIFRLKMFINEPLEATLSSLALDMRKDLYDIKTRIQHKTY